MSYEVVLEKNAHVKENDFECDARVTIGRSHAADIDFVYGGIPYTFCITKWRGRGFSAFLKLFHTKPRDSKAFGTLIDDEYGFPVARPNDQQGYEAVAQSCLDIMACVGRILAVYGQATLGYATWYNSRATNEFESYDVYVARIACRCIADCKFAHASSDWKIVL